MFKKWLLNKPYAAPYPVALTSLETFKTYINTAKTTSDEELKRCILGASMTFIESCGRTFMPFDDTRSLNWQSADRLRLDDDLLSITSITDSTGALSGGQYVTIPQNNAPIEQIQTLGTREFTYNTNRENAISIVGTWGFNPNPATMWKDSLATSSAVADAVTKTVAVSSVANIKTYQTIKINNEYMFVTGISSLNLTVDRGVNGSTAAAHASSQAVYVYQVPKDIELAVLSLAGFIFDSRDNYGSVVATVDGAVEIGKTFPEIVPLTCIHYKRQ